MRPLQAGRAPDADKQRDSVVSRRGFGSGNVRLGKLKDVDVAGRVRAKVLGQRQ